MILLIASALPHNVLHFPQLKDHIPFSRHLIDRKGFGLSSAIISLIKAVGKVKYRLISEGNMSK